MQILSDWESFFLFLVWWDFKKSWMGMEMCQILSCIYWVGHGIFILYSVSWVNHANWFFNVKPDLYYLLIYSSDFDLVILCDWFLHLFHKGCWAVISLSLVAFLVSESCWSCGVSEKSLPTLNRSFSSSIFWRNLCKIGITFSLNLW